MTRLMATAVIALVCTRLVGQAQALDQEVFGKIGPVLSYDPATGRTSPFYPIGWYHLGPVTSLETMRAMAESGSNTVLLADIGTSPDRHYGFVQQDLDWAQQCGMKVVIGIWRSQTAGVDRNKPASYEHLNWIHRFKGHPALLGWQLGDEEAGNPSPDHVREIQDVAHLLKQWDPNHQRWQVVSTGVPESQIISYMNGTDVYSLDFYQIFKTTAEFAGSGSLLSAYTQHASIAASRPWAGNVNITQGLGPDRGDLALYRFPTAAEYRWNVFSNLASVGARGTLNWVHFLGDAHYSNPQMFKQFRDQTAKPVMQELAKLKRAMETGWNVATTSLDWTNKASDATQWSARFHRISRIVLHDEAEQKYFIVVTNNGDAAQEFSLTVSQLLTGLKDLQVAASTGGARESLALVEVGNGAYRLNARLPPYGVGVYELNASK